MATKAVHAALQTADQSITGTTLVATEMLEFVPAARQFHFELWVPFTLAGITSGYKFELLLPSGFSSVIQTTKIANGITQTLIVVDVEASLSVRQGGLASIGNHELHIKGTFTNGAAPGYVELRAAQNTNDAVNAITIKAGAILTLIAL